MYVFIYLFIIPRSGDRLTVDEVLFLVTCIRIRFQ